MKIQSQSQSDGSTGKNFSAAILFRLALLALTTLPFMQLFANNLQVSSLSFNQGAGTVSFNLGWDNGWRNNTAPPNNWDAAWVFVKFRDCTAGNAVQFTHGTISTTISDHIFGGTTALEPTLRDGTGNSIDPPPNNTGVMLRRAIDATTGTVSASITLKINNMPASGTLDIRVYAIEMVYIPSGSYVLGDGNGTNISYYGFATSNGGLSSGAVSSESAQSVYDGSPGSQYCTPCGLTATFPKGFGAFYIMKYEISQGQYADFLNGAFSVAQSNHFSNNNGNSRHTITNIGSPPAQYAAGASNIKADRACNYLNWSDEATYLDWAALRPLTEMEYEKACRGSLASVPFEAAWGTITATAAGTIAGTENGTETISTSNANANAGSVSFSGGDGGSGPLRCGIFATPTSTTRIGTGASYYGVMELSGNVSEFYIHAYAGQSGFPSGSGVSDGDGMLDINTGNFNATNWPTSSPYVIRRGGHWTSTTTGARASTTSYLNVSDRNQAGSAADLTTRANTTGGRGGR